VEFEFGLDDGEKAYHTPRSFHDLAWAVRCCWLSSGSTTRTISSI